MHDYTLDYYGATRQKMPEIFIWHFLRSMAAALAYCQAGWKDGDLFVVKDGWRPIIHQDVVSGNVLLQWHKNEALPQLILSDFGDAAFLDTMPSPEYDYLLRAMRGLGAQETICLRTFVLRALFRSYPPFCHRSLYYPAINDTALRHCVCHLTQLYLDSLTN